MPMHAMPLWNRNLSAADPESREREVSLNYQVFLSELPALMARVKGGYALYRRQCLVEVFDSPPAALSYGFSTFPDRLFSVQEITDEPLDLGGLFDAPSADSL